DAGRQKCRDAWADWWVKNGAAVELPRPIAGPPRELGYTVFALIENGQVIEMDRAGKVRWQLNGLAYPADVRILPGDRVLIAESNGNRVTERNLKNEILWERRLNNSAVSCQRLPSGNTFMACRSEIIEVNPSGKDVFTFRRPNGDIMAAQKMRDGQIILTTSSGQWVRLHAAGKEGRDFVVGHVALGRLEAL